MRLFLALRAFWKVLVDGEVASRFERLLAGPEPVRPGEEATPQVVPVEKPAARPTGRPRRSRC